MDQPAAALGRRPGRRDGRHRAGLLVLTPGDGALDAAGWVWPPAALVLAVWMARAARRATTGRSRWLLYPVIGLVAVTAVGGAVETVTLARDHGRFEMTGALYDVGGHRLHLNCTGTGSPTVVLENGLNEISPLWSAHHRAGRPHHPGLRLRPGRSGLERRRRRPAGRPSPSPPTCTPCWPAPASTARTSSPATPPAARSP